MLTGLGASWLLAACRGASDTAPPTTTGVGSTTSTTGGAAETSVPDPSTVEASGSSLTAADFEPLGICVLLAEQTAGPFPLDEQFRRRDITEGYPGHPVRLGLRVIDEACRPVAGAAVEVWHCDATGDYSAFADGGGGKDEGEGTTFLRGTQVSNDDGIVEFLTIYPGWYRGRAVHIHLRVRIDDELVLTSQLYFDDDYTAGVYTEAPYDEFGPPDTTNAQDRIAGDVATNGTLLSVRVGETPAGAGSIALLNLGIARS